MKSNFINTDEYPEADRQYKDRLFRFVFQKPEDLPFPQTCGLLQRDKGYSDRAEIGGDPDGSGDI